MVKRPTCLLWFLNDAVMHTTQDTSSATDRSANYPEYSHVDCTIYTGISLTHSHVLKSLFQQSLWSLRAEHTYRSVALILPLPQVTSINTPFAEADGLEVCLFMRGSECDTLQELGVFKDGSITISIHNPQSDVANCCPISIIGSKGQ